MAGRLMKGSRSPVIAIQERVPVKLNRRKRKTRSGDFEVKDQGQKNGVKDDKTSARWVDGLQTDVRGTESNYWHT